MKTGVFILLLTGLLWAVGTRTLQAQSIGPAYSSGRGHPDFPVQPFAVVEWGGDVFIIAKDRQDSDTRGTPATTTKTADLFCNEGVDLKAQGYLYHPNLVDWNANIRLGLSQQNTSTGDISNNTNGTILGFDLSTFILKEKPVSFRVYANMNQSTLDRSFAQPTQLDTQTQGGEMLIKSHIPISVLLEHRTINEKDEVRNDMQDILLGHFAISDERDRDWRTSLIYEHEQNNETMENLSPGGPTSSADLSYIRDEANLSHQWNWGPGLEKDGLSGQYRALNRSGYYVQQSLSAEERLDLIHSRTLSSYYRALFATDESPDQKDQNIEGEAGVRKKFYKSLEATLHALGNQHTYIDGSQQYYGGYLDLDYRKKTPLGLLSSTLNLGYEMHQDQAVNGTRHLTNEAVTLVGIMAVILQQPNVQLSSVVVTNTTHTITYVLGVDYTLNPFGTFTEIARLGGGGINDGDTVLVSYIVTGARSADYVTSMVNWTVRLDLKDLPASLYADYRINNNTLQTGDDPGYLDQTQSLLLGAEVRPLKDLRISLEHEWRTQILFPSYMTDRVRAGYTHNLTQDLSLAAGAAYEMLHYTNGEQFGLTAGRDFLETYNGNANVTAKLGRNLLLRLNANYYHQRGRDNGDQLNVGPALLWTAGRTEVSLDSSYRIYTQETDSGQSLFIGIKLTRYF